MPVDTAHHHPGPDDPLPGPPPVRWGVLGATSEIARLAVLPALAESPKADVVALASLSGLDADFPSHFGVRRIYDRYEHLLGDREVEAVYIPLPNSLHAEWTVKAAAAGKHVLCEKPLASTAAEAAAMAEACARAGVLLMEAYMTPFHPRSAMVEDQLVSGKIGDLRLMRSSFTFPLADGNHRWRGAMGGGALLDVGIYCLAPMLAVAGLPERLTATGVTGGDGVDATFSGRLEFADGLIGEFCVSFELPEYQRFEVLGTDARLTVNRPFTPGPADTTIRLTGRDRTPVELEAGGANPYRGMIDHVGTVLRHGTDLRRGPEASVALLGVLDDLRLAGGMR
jgi:xylose dehydrogenase (NAD/NADP)